MRRCSFDIFIRIIIIQNANEGYFCRNVFRCLLRPHFHRVSLLIRCSFVQRVICYCAFSCEYGAREECVLCQPTMPSATASVCVSATLHRLRWNGNMCSVMASFKCVCLSFWVWKFDIHSSRNYSFVFFCGFDRNALALLPVRSTSRFKWNIIATKLNESHRRGIQDRCEECAAWRSKCIHFDSECLVANDSVAVTDSSARNNQNGIAIANRQRWLHYKDA